jgi:hypothetical protein
MMTVGSSPLRCKVPMLSTLTFNFRDTWRRVSKIGADSAT